MNERSFDISRILHERAQRTIVGGVNSPARAFRSVGGDPLFAVSADGCRLTDADGNSYVDYIGSWGPMIAGHAHPAVVEAVRQAASSGTSFGVSTEGEIRLAEKIRSMMPSMELLRMVNSGTEATMSAVRVARGHTCRSRVVKFAGCYHGHGDSFLIKAGSGATTLGVPDSAGVTPGTAADTLTARFNDLDSVDELIEANSEEIAAIIVEPVAGNMGTVPPAPGFLEGLRQRATDRGIILIFDEVMTGFRLAPGGAQDHYGVTPDLTTLGKIVGGGLPVGVYGGRADIMRSLAPLGPVYQAGTLSGNPLAVAAGLAMLEIIDGDDTFHQRLDKVSEELESGLVKSAYEAGVPITINRVGSMMTVFFNNGPVNDYESSMASDSNVFAKFFRGILGRGILLPPSQFEAMFVSSAHDPATISETIEAASGAFRDCA